LTQWRGALDTLATAFEAKHAHQETVAHAGYVARLQKRHQTALDPGDSQAAARYAQLLADAGANN